MATDPQVRVVLVEDDLKLAESVSDFLEGEGMSVLVESRGDKAYEVIMEAKPDLVLLDLMLPGKDGLSVCRELRPDFDGTIIMLTARGEDMDEILGLEIGADDYIAKPVRPRVLLARMRAQLRRQQKPSDEGAPGVVCVGGCEVDPASRIVRMEGTEVSLTSGEFDALLYLARRAGQVITREELYRDLRGIEYDGIDRSVDVRISRIRQKLEADPSHPKVIKSVRGIGYLMAPSTGLGT